MNGSRSNSRLKTQNGGSAWRKSDEWMTFLKDHLPHAITFTNTQKFTWPGAKKSGIAVAATNSRFSRLMGLYAPWSFAGTGVIPNFTAYRRWPAPKFFSILRAVRTKSKPSPGNGCPVALNRESGRTRRSFIAWPTLSASRRMVNKLRAARRSCVNLRAFPWPKLAIIRKR